MTNAIQKTPAQPAARPSALNLMASRLSCDPAKLLTTLKATVFKGANDEEVMALCLVANEYRLNPLLKEMYAFPAKGGGVCPIVSVDGWNKMLLRQPDYDGKEFAFEVDQEGRPISCTATIFVKGREHAEKITEYYDECQRNTDSWKNMPFRMLRNRTLCQASRMAFGLSGVYHHEEVPEIVEVSSAVSMPTELPQKIIASQESEAKPTPQIQLEAIVTGAGFSFDEFHKWGADSNLIPDADSISAWAEVPAELATRLMRNKAGMLTGIGKFKAGAV